MEPYHLLSDTEKRDIARFDYGRLLRSLAWRDTLSGIEAELVAEGKAECLGARCQTNGITLPRALVRRDMTATGGTSLQQGGNTIQTDKAGLVDGFFNRLVFRQGGATILENLRGDIDLPRLVPDSDPDHKTENASADELSPTTAQLSLSPKRLPAYVDISGQLLMQSSTSLEAWLGQAVTGQLPALAESKIINGGGSAEPTGILSTSGIGSVVGGTNGAAPDWADIVELETDVALSNADVGSLHYLTNAAVRSKLKRTPKVATTDSAMIWDDRNGGLLNGYVPLVTNSVPSDLDKGSSTDVCSAILFGNFADLVMACWAGASFELLTDQDLGKAGMYRLYVVLYYDGGLIRPASWSAMQDALTT